MNKIKQAIYKAMTGYCNGFLKRARLYLFYYP